MFIGLTVLSSLICLTTAAVWVTARDPADLFAYHSRQDGYTLIRHRTGIWYFHYSENRVDRNPFVFFRARPWSPGWHDAHFDYFRSGGDFRYRDGIDGAFFDIGAPYWFICFLTAIAPAAWLTLRHFHNRPPSGLCPKCRYDLGATPERCPECGTVVAEVSKKQGSATEDTEYTEKGKDIIATDKH
jgi:hypothetical protein